MNRKGQALVEFVLILPIFILMMFAIVDFGMILSKKNELENISIDVVAMVKNNDDIVNIKSLYPNVKIDINRDDKYTKIIISDDVDVMTPGLNRILGNPYNIKVERTIPNVET